ncbi:hypothetical protein BHE74_00013177, partial [Ensete ventricosum]
LMSFSLYRLLLIRLVPFLLDKVRSSFVLEACRLLCSLARAATNSGMTTSSGLSQGTLHFYPFLYIILKALILGVDELRLTVLNTDGDNQSCDLLDRVEVLMVTSPGRLDLVFPKDTALGVWEFRSKSRQKACSLEGTCKGYMFALEVTEELDCYPEKDSRDRKWVSV